MERISIDPKICHGKPCIKRTRIAVHIILDLLSAGETVDTILQIYPHLTKDDILSCVNYKTLFAANKNTNPTIH